MKPNGPESPVAPSRHEIKNVQLFIQEQVVQINTRAPLAIRDTVTVLPWDVVEGIFLTVLQMRLQQRGIVMGLQQTNAPSPPPDHRQ